MRLVAERAGLLRSGARFVQVVMVLDAAWNRGPSKLTERPRAQELLHQSFGRTLASMGEHHLLSMPHEQIP